jgi:soluble lytic murein transglycosylase-like protein
MAENQTEDLIRFYSARFLIPFALSVAQMEAESSGNPNALSPAGARGLFQVMPATAIDLLFEPEVNVMISRFYLKFLYDLVQPMKAASLASVDRWRMALAAYDAGPGTLALARTDAKNAGVNPDNYDLIFDRLPAETQTYVGKIWAEFCQASNSQA